jgi:phosphatidylinositol alpha-1,6-mannosyltransferase
MEQSITDAQRGSENCSTYCVKKILLISSEFPPGPGGIGYHAYSLSVSLVEKGYKVVVMSPADFVSKDEVVDFDRVQKFDIIRYPRIGWQTYFHRISMTRAYLKQNQISAVILTGKFSLWQGWFIKLFFKDQKTLAILHGSEVNLKNSILRKFTHLSINAADTLVAVSKFTREIMPSFIKTEREIHIIPNGIFLSVKKNHENEIHLNGHPKLITVGHVSQRKGQHRVIKALPELVKLFPDIKYHIVGRPVNQVKLEKLAEVLGVQNHIQFHGRIKNHSDLSMYYKNADIFMLLSENQADGDVEGYGIVALEANECGLPGIGAKYCGVEDAVDNGNSGYLVDGNNVKEISKAVVKCMEEKDRLAAGSIKWADNHQWKEIVKMYEVLI